MGHPLDSLQNGFFTVSCFKHFIATLLQREADCSSDMLVLAALTVK
jgi:hypothetical protein